MREATLETIKLIKETGPLLDESLLGEARKSGARKSRDRGGSGSRSARPIKGGLTENNGSGEHSPIGARNMKSPTAANSRKPLVPEEEPN